MEKVAKMRRYRTADVQGSQFFSGSTKNKDFAERDLSLSGLTIDDIEGFAPSALQLMDHAIAGYQIPYFGLDGRPLVTSEGYLSYYRVKMEFPKGFLVKSKYNAPSNEQAAKHGVPGCPPYIPPIIHLMESDGELICAEGEKKAAAVVKYLGLPAFGIGGCQNWRDPDKSGNPHPWILELLRMRNVTHLKIIPDADILRYDIITAYGTFVRAIEQSTAGKVKVTLLHPPGKIDDLLLEWGDTRTSRWVELPFIDDADLVQSIRSLITRYGLAFKAPRNEKDPPTVMQHSSNVMTLMREHPAFPKIWLNEDNNQVMIGEEASEPNLTDMTIANYFQRNLQFDKVKHNDIHTCVLSLARENRKSPFLEYVKAVDWDGTYRLDTWLNDYWGVVDDEFSREIASKWLISACARLDKPGTKLDWMFIAIGKQGTGKTSMPGVIFDGKVTTLYGDHNDKDLHMKLHASLCVGFDELDTFGKKETATLKAMVTTAVDTFRPPYGAVMEQFPRRFTMYGCGNSTKFLQYDASGYRRYAILTVDQKLDFAGLTAVRDQLWAEAWHRYQTNAGEYWMINNASERAEKYVIPNLMEDVVVNWVSKEMFDKKTVNTKDGFLYFSMTILLAGIDMVHEIRNSNVTRQITTTLVEKLGATEHQGSYLNGQRGRYYKIAITE